MKSNEKKKVTKKEVMRIVHEKINEGKKGYLERYTYVEVSEIIDVFLEIITNTLLNGEEVCISGFGKFYLHAVKGKKRYNFQTHEMELQLGRRCVRFKMADRNDNILKNKEI